MLEDKDIEKIIKSQKEAFVTKEEFENFIEIVATKEEVKSVDKKIDRVMDILVKMDGKLDEATGLKHRVEYIENILSVSVNKK
jgi:trehalose-6-phosphate synthase